LDLKLGGLEGLKASLNFALVGGFIEALDVLEGFLGAAKGALGGFEGHEVGIISTK
jgi:hypothetical protein